MNLKAISVVLIASVAMIAGAQTPDKPIGVDARVGAFFPTDSGTQNAGNTWMNVGVDFELHRITPSAALNLSFDYSYREGYRSLPILVNYVLKKGPIYILGGAGGNFNRIPENDGSIDSKTNFAWDAGIGYDLTKNGGAPIFVEGRYFGNKESVLNGFAAFIGIRI